MLIFVEGGKPENPEENPQSIGENQQQTQLTCADSGGKRASCRYSTHASHGFYFMSNEYLMLMAQVQGGITVSPVQKKA
jgi:hypothetical protein